LKYRYAGKEKLISLGLFPHVGLKEARERRDEAKRLLANGIDPSANRKAERNAVVQKVQNTFEVVANEWLEQQRDSWAQSHYRTIVQRLQNDVFPFIGTMSVEDIRTPNLLELLRRIEKREAFETAHRVRTSLGQIFRYAISTGRMETDPTRDLKGALRPVKIQHLPAVTDPKRVGELLRILEGHRGGPIVSGALRLAPLVFVSLSHHVIYRD
jgi:integrase